jgi:hypothetical protein
MMAAPHSSTAFVASDPPRGSSPVVGKAWLRLLVCASLVLFGTFTTPPSPRSNGTAGRPGDGMAFKHVVDAMKTGQPYYAAMAATLASAGYPSSSVFNWRTPLLYELLARLGSWTWGRVLLTALAATAAAATALVAARVSRVAAAMTATAALGMVVMMSAPAAVGMAEAWAGCLMTLSVCAYSRRRPAAGVSFGLAALAARELVGPYCLAATLIAAHQRRWREVTAWAVGGTAYLLFYWGHWTAVAAHRMPGALSHQGSWIAWGGVAFLVSTVRWHGGLLLLPWACSAATLGVIAAGVLSPGSGAHLRASAGLYAVLFLAVGQPFNDYWGFLAWPSWCLAFGLGLAALVDDGSALVHGLLPRTG